MSPRRHLIAPALALALSPAPALPGVPYVPTPAQAAVGNDIVAVLQSSGRFTILLKALAATGLDAALKSAPHLTLFAPTDAAFAALGPARIAALLSPANATTLEEVLAYHLVGRQLDLARMAAVKAPVVTVETGKLRLYLAGATPRVDDADILQANVRASNGLIEVIDEVLLPPGVAWPTVAAEAAPAARVL